eukprot:TRINITY_DN33768_c0_g1_i1.p1 TRINITY_DN33768_c0_g1~~TRINITY_DN33768_c0_g1_i1.p1  ORF type:complete len:464 (+),score=116.33 TRINITY_DN33768_c0_g1_i1:56-1393(+)
MPIPVQVVNIVRDNIQRKHGDLKKGYTAMKGDLLKAVKDLAGGYADMVVEDDPEALMEFFIKGRKSDMVPLGHRAAVDPLGVLGRETALRVIKSSTAMTTLPAKFVSSVLQEGVWKDMESKEMLRCGVAEKVDEEAFLEGVVVSFTTIDFKMKTAKKPGDRFTHILTPRGTGGSVHWRTVLASCEHQKVSHLCVFKRCSEADVADLSDAAACFPCFRYLKEVWVPCGTVSSPFFFRVVAHSDAPSTVFSRLATIRNSNVAKYLEVSPAAFISGQYERDLYEDSLNTTLRVTGWEWGVPKVLEVGDTARQDAEALRTAQDTVLYYQSLLQSADREIEEVKTLIRPKGSKKKNTNTSGAYLGLEAFDAPEGIKVHSVVPFTPAYYAGIPRDSIVTAIDTTLTPTIQHMSAYLASSPPSPVSLHLTTPAKLSQIVPLELETPPAGRLG